RARSANEAKVAAARLGRDPRNSLLGSEQLGVQTHGQDVLARAVLIVLFGELLLAVLEVWAVAGEAGNQVRAANVRLRGHAEGRLTISRHRGQPFAGACGDLDSADAARVVRADSDAHGRYVEPVYGVGRTRSIQNPDKTMVLWQCGWTRRRYLWR